MLSKPVSAHIAAAGLLAAGKSRRLLTPVNRGGAVHR